jgi:tRNA pseudouridine38-40 synthase
MPRYALLLAYDGTAFAGWWRQPGLRTVGCELDAAFARLGEPAAEAVGASRTDAGVHARGQTAHVDCQRTWEPGALARALARQLPADVVCRGVAAVADTWHAVHDAAGKTYRYRLAVSAAPEPFLAPRIAWRPPFAVPLAGLQDAARLLPGAHDFAAFARRGEQREDLHCLLHAVTWYDCGGYRICRVRGSRFAYRLVRSLVGGMVATAQGTVSHEAWALALAGTATPAAQQQAPAHGLCLERVHYAAPPAWSAG